MNYNPCVLTLQLAAKSSRRPPFMTTRCNTLRLLMSFSCMSAPKRIYTLLIVRFFSCLENATLRIAYMGVSVYYPDGSLASILILNSAGVTTTALSIASWILSGPPFLIYHVYRSLPYFTTSPCYLFLLHSYLRV